MEMGGLERARPSRAQPSGESARAETCIGWSQPNGARSRARMGLPGLPSPTEQCTTKRRGQPLLRPIERPAIAADQPGQDVIVGEQRDHVRGLGLGDHLRAGLGERRPARRLTGAALGSGTSPPADVARTASATRSTSLRWTIRHCLPGDRRSHPATGGDRGQAQRLPAAIRRPPDMVPALRGALPEPSALAAHRGRRSRRDGRCASLGHVPRGAADRAP
jgi:hypothetical protein